MLRLEKLDISGFKSFPDRTMLTFGQGITGVVGPNGCGKSNIAEAISWVLGEQSAKSLRGGKMEDVIFNGTRDRKPLGLAEVTLTLIATEDIAARDSESRSDDDENKFDAALESADHAAFAARSLVEEMTPPQADAAAPVEGAEPAGSPEPHLQPESRPADKPRPYRPRKRTRVVVSAGERVTVGRRLYRTGDSDYLLNGRACLLRDIQDLFAGTGLGGAHYAIIEQGRIGQILSSKPLDRRALIEEAAGITRFKSRRRAAELKLESAKQNLTRLNDIISEVERQANSLKRQAAKSRRYRRLHDEMRAIQKIIFTADYYRLTEAASAVAHELESAADRQRKLDAELGESEALYRAVAAQARQSEDGLASLKERAAAVELEADRARNRLAFEAQQLAETGARVTEVNRGQQALVERLGLLDAESERRLSDLRSLQAEVNAQQASLTNRESDYQSEVARLRETETNIEALRQRMLIEVAQTERIRNNRSNLEDVLSRLELKRSNLLAERERASVRRDEASSELGRVRHEGSVNQSRLADLAERIRACGDALASAREQGSRAQKQMEEAEKRLASTGHRLASLEDVNTHHSYYSDAVQQILLPEQASRINALGTLADFVDVEPQYERLIESLFGRELQCVLVPTIDDALAGVEYLNSAELGRGSFLVVGLHGGEPDRSDYLLESAGASDDGESKAPGSDSAPAGRGSGSSSGGHRRARPAKSDDARPGEPGPIEPRHFQHGHRDEQDRKFDEEATAQARRFQLDVLRAVDLMGLRAEIKAVVERAFPEKCAACVVPDIEAALELSIENGWRTYVTYNGEQVVNGRLITTGAQAGQKGTSLFGLRREIKQLGRQVEELRAGEERCGAELGRARSRIEDVEKDALGLDAELRDQEKLAARLNSEIEGLTRDLERADQHMRVIESELQQAAEEATELGHAAGQLSLELSAAEASRDAVQQTLTTAQSEFTAMRASVEKLAEELSSARASVAARVERLNASRSEMRRLESQAEDLQSRINSNRLEIYESQTRIEQLAASQAEGQAAAERLDSERAELARQTKGEADALAEVRTRADEIETTLAQLRQTVSAAHDRRGQIEVERARIESEADHLSKLCFSELAMSIQDVVTSVELGRQPLGNLLQAATDAEAEAAPEQAGSEQASQATPPPSLGEPLDIESMRARLDELRVKMNETGPVNMMALEELEEAEERFKFLSVQRQDILDSIKGTEDALAEIKRRSRERFRHAFVRINENFQGLFIELFGGGRGEMVLIDEEDALESGIDLISQPPGKRLQNVLLLSGGEKAMAALALVLAIFQYRPSPFCVLDEVDAPLDEVNVSRFSGKILEMSHDTQFLLITHNKRTMEAAGALYGVTMEEPGVSKLVSVKFD